MSWTIEKDASHGPSRADASHQMNAVVIGSGPNGLAAAIVCAMAGLRVTVFEAEAAIGGGARTTAVTLPGFRHDHCSSVFPLGIASPFFRALPLHEHGLEWVQPPYPLAHPLEDGSAIVVERSLAATAAGLGADARAYEQLFAPLVRDWELLVSDVLAPLRWPGDPWLLARFGAAAAQPATWLARRFRTTAARAVFAGVAAHSGESLDAPLTSAFALLLGTLAHAVGWPVARGGAQSIADALAGRLLALGGEIVTSHRVESLAGLPPATITLCDVAPEQLATLAAGRLPSPFTTRLRRFRRSSASFKIDWALDGPIPWRAEACARAATVHVGGTLEEIAASEAAAREGRVSDRPFVIVTQPSVCDDTRAPSGSHAAWGYCHVPLGTTVDMTAAIERQIERFAPGFRARVVARHVVSPAALARGNPNFVGGDISGGAYTIRQFVARPTWRRYGTPVDGVYLCSASTPPGAGVHGMCGYWAARTALARLNHEAGTR
jgi:phytoene dehydrogenase-like protein